MAQQSLFELNPAESILAPFHDERNASRLPVRIIPGTASHLGNEYGWDSTKLLWDNCPAGTLAGKMALEIGGLPERFEDLIFCVAIPVGVAVQFEALQDGSWCPMGEAVQGNGNRIEVTRPRGIGCLTGLGIAVTALQTGPMQIESAMVGRNPPGHGKRLDSTGSPRMP